LEVAICNETNDGILSNNGNPQVFRAADPFKPDVIYAMPRILRPIVIT
jgi:hypothetical protein